MVLCMHARFLTCIEESFDPSFLVAPLKWIECLRIDYLQKLIASSLWAWGFVAKYCGSWCYEAIHGDRRWWRCGGEVRKVFSFHKIERWSIMCVILVILCVYKHCPWLEYCESWCYEAIYSCGRWWWCWSEVCEKVSCWLYKLEVGNRLSKSILSIFFFAQK